MNKKHIMLCAGLIAAAMGGGCANTLRGVKQDAERATEKTAAAVETVDVKSALIADARVDATNINVDTIASTKTVVLKGQFRRFSRGRSPKLSHANRRKATQSPTN